MKVIYVSVRRPEKARINDKVVLWRDAFVISESFDDAIRKAVAHFNDLDGVEDYYVSSVNIQASTEEDEGGVLLI